MNGDEDIPYESVQESFDAATGPLPDLGAGTSAPAAAAPPVTALAPPVEPGWPVELFELLHIAAFSALGEKWNLSPEQSRVLGKTGKAAWDRLMPPEKQGPFSAYLAALGVVVTAKIGVEYLEKLQEQVRSAASKAANTPTGASAAASGSSASPAAESQPSFLSSVAVPADV